MYFNIFTDIEADDRRMKKRVSNSTAMEEVPVVVEEFERPLPERDRPLPSRYDDPRERMPYDYYGYRGPYGY
tara:strand:+ start:194 stop:409 length:216 start_codon:yes stop_codon:yes gene_type:complete